MNLEWFRTHKKIVYAVIAPLVIISFALVFPSDKSGRGGSTSLGPSATLTIRDQTVHMNPSEIIAVRSVLAQFKDAHEVHIDEALIHSVAHLTAESLGLDVGDTELDAEIYTEVRQQIQHRESSLTNNTVTDAQYQKLLTTMQLTTTQFQQMVRQLVLKKRFGSLACHELTINDGKLFVEYCKNKEVARLRFKTLKSEDFLAQVVNPTDAEIKDFYEKNKELKYDGKESPHDYTLRAGVLKSEPTLSAELFYLNTDKLFAEIKATEADLKTYWETHKQEYKKDAPKEGDKPYPAGEEFKPFDSVKKELEEKWIDAQKGSKARAHFIKIDVDLERDTKAYQELESKKPVAEQKPFDIEAWAKKNDLGYWVTLPQVKDLYESGKREVNAPDAFWVAERFSSAEMAEGVQGAVYKKSAEGFTTPVLVDEKNPNSGYVKVRTKQYTAKKLKTFEEAKSTIAEHLKVLAAVKLATAEAKKIYDNWIDGKNLLPIESLDEVIGDSKHKHGLLLQFFETPLAVGEILPVADGMATDTSEKPATPKELKAVGAHKQVYIGFAVERTLPTTKTFEKDTEYKRDADKQQISYAETIHQYIQLESYLKEKSKYNNDIPSPPLFETIRQRGQ